MKIWLASLFVMLFLPLNTHAQIVGFPTLGMTPKTVTAIAALKPLYRDTILGDDGKIEALEFAPVSLADMKGSLSVFFKNGKSYIIKWERKSSDSAVAYGEAPMISSLRSHNTTSDFSHLTAVLTVAFGDGELKVKSNDMSYQWPGKHSVWRWTGLRNGNLEFFISDVFGR